MEWYLEALRKYADFSGRSRRKEYWMFTLMNLVVAFGIGFLAGLLSPALGLSQTAAQVVGFVYWLAVLVPSLAVWVRRLHDVGRSAWWILLILVPIVGAIVLIVWAVKDSDAGTNQYGPNPKLAMA